MVEIKRQMNIEKKHKFKLIYEFTVLEKEGFEKLRDSLNSPMAMVEIAKIIHPLVKFTGSAIKIHSVDFIFNDASCGE